MMASDHPSEIELLEEVEGELEPERSAEVRAHLERCAVCSANVAQLVHAREALQSAPLLELPAARVREMVATFPKPERRRRFVLGRLTTLQRVAAAAAALAVVVVAVTVVTTRNDNADERTAAGEVAATADQQAPALEMQAQDATTPESSAQAAPFEAAPPAEPAEPAEPEPQAQAAPAPEEGQAPPPTEVPAPTKTAAPPREETAPPEAAAAAAPVASLEGTAADVVKLLEQLGFTATAIDETTVQVTGASAAEVAQALEGRPAGSINVFVEEETP
jgi:hypothetical protein